MVMANVRPIAAYRRTQIFCHVCSLTWKLAATCPWPFFSQRTPSELAHVVVCIALSMQYEEGILNSALLVSDRMQQMHTSNNKQRKELILMKLYTCVHKSSASLRQQQVH